MSKQVETTGYQVAFRNWPKLAGPRPTMELIEQAHGLGCRPGKQALAIALCLRDGGASDGQMKMAVIAGWGASGSHHNKRRDLQSAGLVRGKNVGVADANGHKVYSVELTERGKQRLAKLAEAAKAADAEKAATKVAKHKAKADRKAKGKAKAEAKVDAPAEPVAPAPAAVEQPAQATA